MVRTKNARSLSERGREVGRERLEIGPIEFGAWIASNVMRRSMEFVILTRKEEEEEEEEGDEEELF